MTSTPLSLLQLFNLAAIVAHPKDVDHVQGQQSPTRRGDATNEMHECNHILQGSQVALHNLVALTLALGGVPWSMYTSTLHSAPSRSDSGRKHH